MTQSTERTLSLVRIKYAFPECPLVQPNADCCGHIRSVRYLRFLEQKFLSFRTSQRTLYLPRIIDGHGKRQICGIVFDDEHRPRHEVLSANYSMDVHKRQASLHREPHAPVIRVIGVGAAISIAEKAVRTK